MPKHTADRIASAISTAGATLKSLVKSALSPRGARIRSRRPSAPLIILANGPSLRRNMEHDIQLLAASHTLAVNFAANTPEFFKVKPRYYVLADPHFFTGDSDTNVSRLQENLSKIDWPMTLFVPRGARHIEAVTANGNITIEHFPFTAFESTPGAERFAFDRQWGMPRPRNVLIPSIMIGLWLGYRKIYILGADHTWTQTLSVNDQNHVVSVQPHFYSDNDREQKRVASTYRDVRMHEILESFSIAFRSYHAIERYARSIGAEIINATPGSFIDAFTRGALPDK